ncbi:MAG: head-tail connector protein [Alphaproteobacteria bacterium]
MKITCLTAPTHEPVSLEEVKGYLRVDGSADDAMLETMIGSAREVVEAYVGCILLKQTWRLRVLGEELRPHTSGGWRVDIPLHPFRRLKATPAIIFAQQEVRAENHKVIERGGVTSLILLRSIPDEATLKFDVEIGLAEHARNIPNIYKQAIQMLVAEMYDNRNVQSYHVGSAAILNESIQTMLHPYRTMRLA